MMAVPPFVDDATLSLAGQGEADVRRDMDLIRKILREIEAREDLRPREVTLDGEDPLAVGYQVEILHGAGFVEGPAIRSNKAQYLQVSVRSLTWEGHDFLAILENETLWGRIKTALSADQIARLPLTALREIGLEAAKRWAMGEIFGPPS